MGGPGGTGRGRLRGTHLQEGLHVQASVSNLPHHVVPAARGGAAVAAGRPVLGTSPSALAGRTPSGGGPGAGARRRGRVGLQLAQALAGGGLAGRPCPLVLAQRLLQALLPHQSVGSLASRRAGDRLKGSGRGQGGILETWGGRRRGEKGEASDGGRGGPGGPRAGGASHQRPRPSQTHPDPPRHTLQALAPWGAGAEREVGGGVGV